MSAQHDVAISRSAESAPMADADPGWTAPGVHGSPLLAVCGLCGGAGTSTLSYLVARFAIAEARGHVLLCDTGGPAGGLAGCTGVQSGRSLPETAAHVARGLPLRGTLYAVDEASSTVHELRVIATPPRLADAEGVEGLEALLGMARSDGVHALTVVDCGTLQRAADRLAMRIASHVAWVLPATASGVRRAERLLACIGADVAGREIVVARRDRRCERPAALRTLRTLAHHRRAPLVLVPYIDDPLGRALDPAHVALQALLGALRR